MAAQGIESADDELSLSAERIKELNGIDKVWKLLYVYRSRRS